MVLVEQNRTALMVAHGCPSVQEQQDVGTVPDVGVGGPAVVVEEVLAFRRGEADTGHGSAQPKVRAHRHGSRPTERQAARV